MSSVKNDKEIVVPLYGLPCTEKLEFIDDSIPSGVLVDQTNDPAFVNAVTSHEIALEGICVSDRPPQVRLMLIPIINANKSGSLS